MKIEMIKKEEGGAKVKISTRLHVEPFLNEFRYESNVYYCSPIDEVFKPVSDTAIHGKRRSKIAKKTQLFFVSEDELKAERIKLWNLLKPT